MDGTVGFGEAALLVAPAHACQRACMCKALFYRALDTMKKALHEHVCDTAPKLLEVVRAHGTVYPNCMIMISAFGFTLRRRYWHAETCL